MGKKVKTIKIASLILSAQLLELKQEAENAIKDLRFVLESHGASFNNSLTYTVEAVSEAEKQYRMVFSNPKTANVEGRELVERLLALYLGEMLIAVYSGCWCIYQGRYYSYSPFVINIASINKNVDVFGFCSKLIEKKGLDGAKEAVALERFIMKAEKIAFS